MHILSLTSHGRNRDGELSGFQVGGHDRLLTLPYSLVVPYHPLEVLGTNEQYWVQQSHWGVAPVGPLFRSGKEIHTGSQWEPPLLPRAWECAGDGR